ncbi:MAG: hypothetical protein ACP5QZ_02850 [Candidatus Sumerlaeaceae bacterium]
MLVAVFCFSNLLATTPSRSNETTTVVNTARAQAQTWDDVARAAVGAVLVNDRQSLVELYRHEAAKERERGVRANELTLSSAIHYLFIMSLNNREAFLRASQEAAKEFRHEELRLRLMQALLDDEYYELNQLKGENRYNRFTRVFNRASSSLSKLALFQPQDAVQLLLDAAYSMRKARTTNERERRMIYLARRFLDEYPEAPERPEVEELLRQLSEKLRRDRVEQEILAGRAAMQTGNYRAAIFHLETAAFFETTNTQALQLLDEARKAQRESEEETFQAVSVSNWEDQLSTEEQHALEQAVRALCAGNAATLKQVEQNGGRLADSAGYARAALLEQNGDHDAAVELLHSIAESAPATPGGRAAAGLLDTPSYNLDTAFDKAVAQLREERKKFIVTGKRKTDDTLYAAGSAAVQSIGQSPATVPALFVTDMLVRGVAEHFHTVVAIDSVVDAGAAYIRRYPGSPRSAEIAKEIADLSSKSGDPVRTRTYLQMAGDEDPARLAKVRENEARQLYASAAQAADLVTRKRLLEQLLAEYPEVKVAKTARKELDKLHPTLAAGSIVLSPKMLAEDKELVAALGLHPEWVDGNKRNGELAQEGIAFAPDLSHFSYRLADQKAFEIREVPKAQRQWLEARAIALYHTFTFKASGKEALHRRFLPLEVEGGAGASGVEIAPKMIPYPEPKKDSRLFE